MVKKKNTHYVPIDSNFLMDSDKIFKSRYTPWIFLYLKLEYNYYIQKLPFKSISLKGGEIAHFFQIDRATVHRCLNELIRNGFITRKERDSYVVKSEKGKYRTDSNNNYLKIYKNLLIDIFHNGANVDDAKVYYFMIINNRHYAFDYKYLKSDLTQTKISKLLGFDSRKTKTILNKLTNLGLISYDSENNEYFTLYSNCESLDLNGPSTILESKDESFSKKKKLLSNDQLIDEYLEKFTDLESIPIRGWFKTSSGNAELPIIYIPGYGNIVDRRRVRVSDGIPPNEEQMNSQIRMVEDNSANTMCVIQ